MKKICLLLGAMMLLAAPAFAESSVPATGGVYCNGSYCTVTPKATYSGCGGYGRGGCYRYDDDDSYCGGGYGYCDDDNYCGQPGCYR